MSKIEIGVGFLITALSGFDLLHSLFANAALIVIGILLIGHGAYDEWLGHKWRLRQRVTKWLVNRHWVLHIETSPSLYFGLWATEPEGRYKLLISREKNAKGILAFSARVPLDETWEPHLVAMTENERQVLTNDLLVLVETMGFGHDKITWPYKIATIQDALPVDAALSEHMVDLKAKAIVRGVIAARSIIRKAIVQSASYIARGQRSSV